MAEIHEHLKATAKPTVPHAAGKSSVVTHQPIQPVSGIVFEQEFFDKVATTGNPDSESSLQTMDDNHTGANGSECGTESETPAISQKNTSSGPRYSFSTEIPETYDDFYLCVLPRDPEMLYVYWELPDGTRSERHNFQEQAPSKEQLVLRVKGQTIDNNEIHISNSYDIPIQTKAADSYVHVPSGANQCSVECGIVNEWGNFRTYTPPCHNYDQPNDATHFYCGNEIDKQQHPDEYRMTTTPVSVGAALTVSGTESQSYFDSNISAPFIRNVDLPVVKLDTTHYLGSATPV